MPVLLAAIASPAAAPTHEALRAAAERVVTQAKYQRYAFDPEQIRDLWQRFWESWQIFVTHLFRTHPLLVWTILAGLCLLLLALLLHMGIVFHRALLPSAEVPSTPVAKHRRHAYLEQAQDAAESQDYLRAVRLLFSDLLEAASGRGWMEARAFHTPRTLARRAERQLPAAWHETLRMASARLENGLYAGRPVSEKDWLEVYASYQHSRGKDGAHR